MNKFIFALFSIVSFLTYIGFQYVSTSNDLEEETLVESTPDRSPQSIGKAQVVSEEKMTNTVNKLRESRNIFKSNINTSKRKVDLLKKNNIAVAGGVSSPSSSKRFEPNASEYSSSRGSVAVGPETGSSESVKDSSNSTENESSNGSSSTSTSSSEGSSTSSVASSTASIAVPGLTSTTGEDTSEFTSVGDDSSTSSTSSNNSSTDSSTSFNCFLDKAEGSYSTAISVGISCSEMASIKYCLKIGGGTCDPASSPVSYSSAVLLNSGDNTYSISYYGQSNSSGEISSIQTATFTISSTTPSLAVQFERINTQTTKLPLSAQVQSNLFGKSNFYYHMINFKTHNPTSSGLNWSCSDILNNHSSLSAPTTSVIQGSYSVTSLSSSDQIDQSIGKSDLSEGDNYIAIILEDRINGTYTCQTQKVILSDFFYSNFSGSGATTVTSGVRSTSGAFVGLGHFQVTPNSSKSGDLENTKSDITNKKGLIKVVY